MKAAKDHPLIAQDKQYLRDSQQAAQRERDNAYRMLLEKNRGIYRGSLICKNCEDAACEALPGQCGL